MKLSPAKRPDYFIGIDPDVDKSGFAVWDGKSIVSATGLQLYELFETLSFYNARSVIHIRLEAGWLLNKSNFNIIGRYGSKAAGERIAKNVGANHEIGKQIEKYCKAKGIGYTLVKPAGYSAYTHEHFCIVTNWPKKVKTNSETRVACLLVYGY